MIGSLLRRQQRTTFLLASGLSTAGSFAGLTAKGWLLLDSSQEPLLLALHFALLSLPTLVASGPAGTITDQLGSELVLRRAQWGLFGAAALAAVAIPSSGGSLQAALLLLSTLGIGIASTFELTARNKYVALLVDQPDQLGRYLASFSVVFNVGKLIGPPVGALLLATTGPALALTLDACSYLFPIATLLWVMQPNRQMEQRTSRGQEASLGDAWQACGADLRHVLVFTAAACLVGFFHPGLAPLIAHELLGASPYALGVFTSVLAAGSISAGLLLQQKARWLAERPGLLLGTCTLVTALCQVGLALQGPRLWSLAMAFGIGAGTASLLAGTNLILQVKVTQVLRGRVAGLGQIAFLGGGGLSGLLAAGISREFGLWTCCGLLGSLGILLAIWELSRRGRRRLAAFRSA